jgi:hypothetical protein
MRPVVLIVGFVLNIHALYACISARRNPSILRVGGIVLFDLAIT